MTGACLPRLLKPAGQQKFQAFIAILDSRHRQSLAGTVWFSSQAGYRKATRNLRRSTAGILWKYLGI